MYPKISRKLYGYLNYAFSGDALFPRHRYGAELFAGLPYSLEASVGMRHLSFSANSQVTIYTGSVGYYVGNYWLSLRSYITPGENHSSVSAAFTARRYLRNPEHYYTVRIGAGFSPELINLQSAAKQFYNLQSQSVTIGYQQPLSRRWTVSGNLALGRQELLFSSGEYSNNIGTSLTMKYRYR
jgi:YaiO family outer membrane protein